MGSKKLLGIIVLACVLVMVGASFYIKARVAEGKEQIAAGQKKINTTNSLFSIVPGTKEVGDGLTSSGQRRINEGQQQVTEYEALANKLQMGGILLSIVGVAILLLWKDKRR